MEMCRNSGLPIVIVLCLNQNNVYTKRKLWIRRAQKCKTLSRFSDIEFMYSLLYPDFVILHIPRRHLEFRDLQALGEHFLTSRSHSQQSVAVMAY